MVYSFFSHWLMFWTWYKFHPPKYKPIPSKAIQKKARQHLKLLMLASAVIPSMGSVDKPYLSKQGNINPNKIITSTTNLCGYNLTELKSRLSKSPLFSLYKGLMNPEVRPVLMDCGASACTGSHLDDFVEGTLEDLETPIIMEGVGGGMEIKQQGIIQYHTIDDDGNPFILKVPGYYAPHIKQSLFSPQILFMTSQKHGSLTLTGTKATLNFPNGVSITLPLDIHSRLFYIPTFLKIQQTADELLYNLQLTQETNTNLSRTQKNLLRCHNALCHVGFSTLRKIGKLGWLGPKGSQFGESSTSPLCSSCQYGKAHQRNTKAKTTTPNPASEGAISQNHLVRGSLVCMDHFVVTELGRLWSSRGQEMDSQKYNGGLILVDVASGKIVVKFQSSLSAADTIKSKMQFERQCLHSGFVVQKYRTDNGTFTAQAMLSHMDELGQTISFSGAGAQHQNGVAERAIKTICESARTIMLHAALRWPEAYDSSLWPMAMQYACDIYNEIPRGMGDITPEEIFQACHSTHSKLLNVHSWGSLTMFWTPK